MPARCAADAACVQAGTGERVWANQGVSIPRGGMSGWDAWANLRGSASPTVAPSRAADARARGRGRRQDRPLSLGSSPPPAGTAGAQAPHGRRAAGRGGKKTPSLTSAQQSAIRSCFGKYAEAGLAVCSAPRGLLGVGGRMAGRWVLDWRCQPASQPTALH
jgi:hypothetical protein